jgi:hypothetical protein
VQSDFGPAKTRQAISYQRQVSPGTKLTVRLVAQALGVSTTPVRDAIIPLIGEGALVNLGLKTVVVSVLTMVTFDEVTKIRWCWSLSPHSRRQRILTTAILNFLAQRSPRSIARWTRSSKVKCFAKGAAPLDALVPFLFVPEWLPRKRFISDSPIDCILKTIDWIRTEKAP